VVEVGLGGRLDATNVLTPLVSAVTHIALEHTDYLGPTVADVAREKAGIAKPGIPFVIGEPDPAIAELLETAARRSGALPARVPASARYEGPLALAGPHQRRNAALAEAVLERLPTAWEATAHVPSVFALARLPGRLDRVGRWLFDVAHNPDAMTALVAALEANPPMRPVRALVGILGDKDWRTMLDRLRGVVDRLWVSNPPSAPAQRAWDLDEVVAVMGDAVVAEPDFDRALACVREGVGTALVCGSFHTVGDAMARLPGFALDG
jgi:dihydrofolate synthase/folylpolyglutamate synthase